MRWLLILISTAALFVWTSAAHADFDVSPRVEGGAIVTYGYDDKGAARRRLNADATAHVQFDMDSPGPNITTSPGFVRAGPMRQWIHAQRLAQWELAELRRAQQLAVLERLVLCRCGSG